MVKRVDGISKAVSTRSEGPENDEGGGSGHFMPASRLRML